jgi:hypothetical protein
MFSQNARGVLQNQLELVRRSSKRLYDRTAHRDPVQVTPMHLDAFLNFRPCLEMFDAVLDSEIRGASALNSIAAFHRGAIISTFSPSHWTSPPSLQRPGTGSYRT